MKDLYELRIQSGAVWTLVKLEILADHKTLYPDMQETLKVAGRLVTEDFDVMV
jgi:thiazole synthase